MFLSIGPFFVYPNLFLWNCLIPTPPQKRSAYLDKKNILYLLKKRLGYYLGVDYLYCNLVVARLILG